jgi:hypothetical protein
MTDRVRSRRPLDAPRGSHDEPAPISNPAPEDHPQAPAPTASALGIVHAQYHRALTLAESGEPAERAAARDEARRLLEVAVALRRRVSDQDVGGTTARVPAQLDPLMRRDPS